MDQYIKLRKPCIFVFALLASLFLLMPSTKISSASAGGIQNVVIFRENFDSVTLPSLPANWTGATGGAGAGFRTVSDFCDTLPNSVFAPSPAATGVSELTSPPILVTGNRTFLNFRQKFALENTWDGGVLEIKIGNAAFVDILSSGATFVAGGYTSTLNTSPNPLSGRLAWSGANPTDFLATSVQLPASAFGQTVQFRWRLGTNDNFAATGWWIDSVTLEASPTAVNSAAISIASNGTANPYPSQITVAGQNGPVTGVTVSLENFSHTAPDDVDILLVGPTGRRIVLMSDVGGNTPVNGISLTFTDAGAVSLPDNAPLAAGIYKPTNIDVLDTFPSPAPQGQVSGDRLDAFYGSNPNGVWSLYVVDDNGDNAGAIAGGWTLDLRTSVNACLSTLDPTAQGFPSTGGSGSFELVIPAGCGWNASTTNSFITITSATSGIGSSVVTFDVAPNAGGARTGLISVTDGFTSRSFQVQQGAGCPTSIGAQELSVTAAGGPGSVSVIAGVACSWIASSNASWVVVTSPRQSGDGTATFNVLPNTARAARSATVSIGTRTLTVNQAGAATTKFDFDGDGRADISVFRSGTWYLERSTSGTAVVQFGLSPDKLSPADFDGDGKADISVFRDGIWYILRSSDGQVASTQFGLAGDVPLPADYDGDGRAEIAVFRAGVWYLLNLQNNQVSVVNFGLPADKPVPADYDGDGKTDVAVFRDGIWYLLRSSQGFGSIQFGIASDRPVPADFDGDGKAELAVYRGGVWHMLSNFSAYSVASFGIPSDIPVAADYDGDGKTDIAVFRDGIWYVLRSSNGQYFAFQFGLLNDRPVPGAFLP